MKLICSKRLTYLAFLGLVLYVAGSESAIGSAKTYQYKEKEENDCDCKEFTKLPGVIWSGRDTLLVEELAKRAAPILWFSPDEPLKNKMIPQFLPCDTTNEDEGRFVYYQITRIVKPRGSDWQSISKEMLAKLDLRTVKSIALKYFFYYERDFGFAGHSHDLENVEFKIDIQKAERDSCGFRARVRSVTGAAHGLNWYSNQLNIVKDDSSVSFPITVLVEEGKHASCPDRNGDGIYTPDYDTNIRVNDAWGVRDVIGTERIIRPYYRSSMTKPRKLGDRVARRIKTEERSRVYGNYRPFSEERKSPDLTYVLESAVKASENGCSPESLGAVAKFESLRKRLQEKNFGELPKVTTNLLPLRIVRFLYGFENKNFLSEVFSLNYRLEGGRHGVSTVLPIGVRGRLMGGWFVPKLSFTGIGATEKRWNVDVMYTPSASRWVDWYAAFGYERVGATGDREPEHRFASEAGLKFRFRIVPFGVTKLYGARLGVRATGFEGLEEIRYIFETGFGAW